jgi:hypothetical protein
MNNTPKTFDTTMHQPTSVLGAGLPMFVFIIVMIALAYGVVVLSSHPF